MPEKKQSCPADAAGLSAELGLSPVPQHIEIHNGIFALHKEMLLTLDGSDSRSVGACEELLAAIERKTGEKPQFKQIKDRQQEEIRLTHLESTVGHCALEKGSDREEGYTLQISPGGIIIRGADSAGGGGATSPSCAYTNSVVQTATPAAIRNATTDTNAFCIEIINTYGRIKRLLYRACIIALFRLQRRELSTAALRGITNHQETITKRSQEAFRFGYW